MLQVRQTRRNQPLSVVALALLAIRALATVIPFGPLLGAVVQIKQIDSHSLPVREAMACQSQWEGMPWGLTRLARRSFIEAGKRTMTSLISPPRAPRRPHFHKFGFVEGSLRGRDAMRPAIEREDQWHWLKDDNRTRPEVLDYLKEENAYFETVANATRMSERERILYDEMLAHYKETETSALVPYGGFFYYTRTEKGKGLSIHCRRPRAEGPAPPDAEFPFSEVRGHPVGNEEILFDENEMANGLENLFFGSMEPSPDHTVMAYAVDEKGNEAYDIKFKRFAPGNASIAPILDVIPGTSGDGVWDKTGRYFFYLKRNDAMRPDKLLVHELGTDPSRDLLLYEETDPEFSLGVGSTSSRRYLILVAGAKETQDISILDLENFCPSTHQKPRPLATRRPGHRYNVDHWGSLLFIVTNKDNATESKLCVVPAEKVGDEASWKDVFAYDSNVQLKGVHSFKDHLVVSGRSDGLAALWIVDPTKALAPGEVQNSILSSPAAALVQMQDACGVYSLYSNPEFDTPIMMYSYESLTTPSRVIGINMNSRKSAVLDVREVPNFCSGDFDSTRVQARSSDGKAEIPVSLVWRRDLFPTGITGQKAPAPLLVDAYGSYGISNDPSFAFTRLTYLNRGIIYAIAHVGGGGELGRKWYNRAKFLTKKNSVLDLIACVEELHRQGISAPEKTAIHGASAGGLLMGATVNLRPDLFRAAVLDVPFVDVLNTMADPDIPLTTEEWQEWGNPNQREFFDYMLEYSPYDNIRPQNYPSIYITAGLNDHRVAYWEPAKFVAKLRALKTDDNLLLLRTDMTSGHFSAADRYKRVRERAIEQAFVMHCLGIDIESRDPTVRREDAATNIHAQEINSANGKNSNS